MGVKNAGASFNLNGANILKINSPKNRVGGPYCVVHTDHQERWSVVALKWEGSPVIGMRWFHGNSGQPISSGYATWFIVPSPLQKIILKNIKISEMLRIKLLDFLDGKIEGDKLC